MTRAERKSLLDEARSSLTRNDYRKLKPPKLGHGPGHIGFSTYLDFLTTMSRFASGRRRPPTGTRFKL